MVVPDFNAMAQPALRRLRAYDPGHDIVALRRRFCDGALLELGSNENSCGASPAAIAAFHGCAPQLHRYPDPLGGDLKQAIANKLGLRHGQVLLGNGSHELLMLLAQVFAGPGAHVLASQFGFAVYAIAAHAAGAPFIAATALGPNDAMPRGHDLAAIARAVDDDTRLIYLANPNNPTGSWFSTDALQTFLSGLPAHVIVVVDEAYMEYVTDPALVSAVSLLDESAQLVVTRTFSKAYGLAGLRVGYACAQPGLLQVLDRIRESFNVNSAGLAACLAAVEDDEHVQWVRVSNAAERQWLADQLDRRRVAVDPSQTNFLLVDFVRDAAPLEARLLERGVVLRPMAGYGLPTCLRITVGTRGENQRLLDALDAINKKDAEQP